MSLDFTVSVVSGNLAVVTPATPALAAALRDLVPEDAPWMGRSLVVELRYISDLVDGLREDGYTVRT